MSTEHLSQNAISDKNLNTKTESQNLKGYCKLRVFSMIGIICL